MHGADFAGTVRGIKKGIFRLNFFTVRRYLFSFAVNSGNNSVDTA